MTTRPAAPATALTRSLGIDLFDGWTAIWNGELALATRLLVPDFRIRFGGAGGGSTGTDALRGPDEFAAFVGRHRAAHPAPGLRYAVDGVPAVDTGGGQVASRWTVRIPDASGQAVVKSGIDILAVADGRIAEVWSLTGSRRFAV